jgi:hypothetical protein
MTTTSVLEANGLSVGYAGRPVVEGIDMSVNSGEIVARARREQQRAAVPIDKIKDLYLAGSAAAAPSQARTRARRHRACALFSLVS